MTKEEKETTELFSEDFIKSIGELNEMCLQQEKIELLLCCIV